MERMGMRIYELIQDRAYVSVGVLDREETKGAVGRNDFFKIGGDELCEPGRAEERAFIETVVGTKREPIQAAVASENFGAAERLLYPGSGLCMERRGVICHPVTELGQAFALGDCESRVSVHHEKVPVAGLLAHEVDQAQGFFQGVRIRVEENGVVIEPFRRPQIQVHHVFPMKLTFTFFHLIPLQVRAVKRMHSTKRFHRQEEDKFEVGNAARRRTPFQRGNKPLSWSHDGRGRPLLLLVRKQNIIRMFGLAAGAYPLADGPHAV